MSNLKAANCKICGKVFLKANFDICPDCIRKEQELIKNINDYCYNKKIVTLEEISKEFNEPLKKLEKFLLDRKLVQIMDKLEMTCKMCGVKYRIVSEGRLYCKICFEKLHSQMNNGNEFGEDPYSKPY
jgi:hypothetical protein